MQGVAGNELIVGPVVYGLARVAEHLAGVLLHGLGHVRVYDMFISSIALWRVYLAVEELCASTRREEGG